VLTAGPTPPVRPRGKVGAARAGGAARASGSRRRGNDGGGWDAGMTAGSGGFGAGRQGGPDLSPPPPLAVYSTAEKTTGKGAAHAPRVLSLPTARAALGAPARPARPGHRRARRTGGRRSQPAGDA